MWALWILQLDDEGNPQWKRCGEERGRLLSFFTREDAERYAMRWVARPWFAGRV